MRGIKRTGQSADHDFARTHTHTLSAHLSETRKNSWPDLSAHEIMACGQSGLLLLNKRHGLKIDGDDTLEKREEHFRRLRFYILKQRHRKII